MCVHRKWLSKKTLEKISKKLFKRTAKPTCYYNKDNSENINKVVKRPYIPIIGPKLRQAFKKKNIKTVFTSSSN